MEEIYLRKFFFSIDLHFGTDMTKLSDNKRISDHLIFARVTKTVRYPDGLTEIYTSTILLKLSMFNQRI